jgi:hypothetical protein
MPLRLVLIPLVFLLVQPVFHPGSAPADVGDPWILPSKPRPEWKRLKVTHKQIVDGLGMVHEPAPEIGEAALASTAAPAVSVETAAPRPPAIPSWQIGELYVESSSVTSSGAIEYRLRASLKANPGSPGGVVSASAKSLSSDVAIVSNAMHFAVRPGDDLDTLSRDAIVVRIPGGQSFEPSMLRWSIQSPETSQAQ